MEESTAAAPSALAVHEVLAILCVGHYAISTTRAGSSLEVRASHVTVMHILAVLPRAAAEQVILARLDGVAHASCTRGKHAAV